MSEKTRDMLLGLVALMLIASVMAVLVGRVRLKDRIAEAAAQGKKMLRDTIFREPEPSLAQAASSSITPGLPPDMPLSSGATAARSRNPAYWITNEDYPAEALMNEWQGTSSLAWTIDTQGRVDRCYVVKSSGHDVLDEAACRMIKRRGRYEPALDAQGRAIPSQDRRRVVWRLAE